MVVGKGYFAAKYSETAPYSISLNVCFWVLSLLAYTFWFYDFFSAHVKGGLSSTKQWNFTHHIGVFFFFGKLMMYITHLNFLWKIWKKCGVIIYNFLFENVEILKVIRIGIDIYPNSHRLYLNSAWLWLYSERVSCLPNSWLDLFPALYKCIMHKNTWFSLRMFVKRLYGLTILRCKH